MAGIDLLPTVIGAGTEKETIQDVVFEIKSVAHENLYNTVTVNFEMQRRNTSKPHIVPRAMYYGATLLRETVPTGDTEYAGLHKVYSIWFCAENIYIENRNCFGEKCEASIRPYIYKHRYNMRREIEEVPDYVAVKDAESDLIEVVIIELHRLGKKVEEYFNVSESEKLLFKAFNNLPEVVGIVGKMCGVNLENFERKAISMINWEQLTEKEVKARKEEARKEGIKEGRITSILELLEDYGTVSESLIQRIREEDDMEVLKRWGKLAARVDSIAEFQVRMAE